MPDAARLLANGGFLTCGIGGIRLGHQLRPGPNTGFNCCLAGEARFIDHMGNEHLLTAGLSCYHAPGGLHRIHAAEGYQERYLICDAKTMGMIAGLGICDTGIVLHHHAGRRALEAACRTFTDLCERSAAEADCMLAFLRCLRLCAQSSAVKRDPMVEILSRLRGDMQLRLDLRQLAEEFEMSYATLHRRVRAACGMAPGALRLASRLERADELLVGQSVQAVARMLGYPSAADFCRQYKRHRGLSPGAANAAGA